jgi:hypothetical protein
MHKFEVIIKRDDEELFKYEISQAQLDVADKLGVSKHDFIEQLTKIKMEEWRNADLSNSK